MRSFDGPSVERLDLKIGFACNNRCDFCAQGEKRNVLKWRPYDEIFSELQRASVAGIRSLVLTGGEPTLHPRILDAVALAKTLGFSSIQIQSNGRRFAYPDFCGKLLDAGATEFLVALHGSTPEIHDGMTQAPGAWLQVMAGLRNLAVLRAQALTNTVVTARNYRDLPALAALFVRLRVSSFQFAFVHIVGTAAKNARWIVPQKKEAVPFIKNGLSIGRRAAVACYAEAVPYCLMQGFEEHVAESLIPDGPIVDLDRRVESWQEQRRLNGKAKRALCRSCRMDSICEGPWKEYPELYGWDEFVPVPN